MNKELETVQDQIDVWKKEITNKIKKCFNCKGLSNSIFCCVRCKYEWMQSHPDLKVNFNGEVVMKC